MPDIPRADLSPLDTHSLVSRDHLYPTFAIMSLHIKVALLLCAILCHSCKGNRGDDGTMDCCLDVSHKVIPRHIVADYKVQDAAMGCRISAVVIITLKDKKLCAPQNTRWVKKLMRRCDKIRQLLGQ
ncbi:C-C motif chemokine 19-like [Heterodontus francisci]|uniref:C-C motif chemokine 19-like n=1 Tax=Heterodontus francisci TaxID=7792 RepID=UPI00355C308D